MKKLGTLCYLILDHKILLALIEYGENNQKWNGVGGYVKAGESSKEAVCREVEEEIGVIIDKSSLQKISREKISNNLDLDVFIATKWEGEPQLIDPTLKKLKWFGTDNIPYSKMHPETQSWLPQITRIAINDYIGNKNQTKATSSPN